MEYIAVFSGHLRRNNEKIVLQLEHVYICVHSLRYRRALDAWQCMLTKATLPGPRHFWSYDLMALYKSVYDDDNDDDDDDYYYY